MPQSNFWGSPVSPYGHIIIRETPSCSAGLVVVGHAGKTRIFGHIYLLLLFYVRVLRTHGGVRVRFDPCFSGVVAGRIPPLVEAM